RQQRRVGVGPSRRRHVRSSIWSASCIGWVAAMTDARADASSGRMRRRLGRVLAAAGVFVGVLIAAALLLLHTAPVRRLVLSHVTQLLQQQNIAFHSDALSYNLL